MPTGKLYLGSTLVSGGALSDQFPSTLLADNVTAASSERPRTVCTASATPHTAGAWVEVDASLSADSAAVLIYPVAATNASGADSSTLLDIGTGGAGAEAVWATVGIGYLTTNSVVKIVPGHIAAGSRVAVRARSAVVSQAVDAVYAFATPKDTAFGAPVTYLADIATSKGLNLTAPGSLNTKGAWLELVASTAADLAALHISPQGAAGTGMAASGVLLDIGVGGAGAEAVVISDIHLVGGAQEFYTTRTPLTYGVDIPAGSRIAARYARAGAGNALDLVLVGAPPA